MDGEASHGLQSFARSGTQSSMAAADRRVPVVFERKTLRDFIWDDGIGKMTKSQTQREMEFAEGIDRRAELKRKKPASASTQGEEEQPGPEVSYGPRLKVVDGKIVVDEESLVLHAAARPMIHTFEEVDETNNRLTAASYGGRKQAGKWKVEDTRRFYRALQVCGSDFTMIQKLFPNRSRKQIKHKFNREQRGFPSLVDAALKVSTTFNAEEYQALVKEVETRMNPRSASAPPSQSEADRQEMHFEEEEEEEEEEDHPPRELEPDQDASEQPASVNVQPYGEDEEDIEEDFDATAEDAKEGEEQQQRQAQDEAPPAAARTAGEASGEQQGSQPNREPSEERAQGGEPKRRRLATFKR